VLLKTFVTIIGEKRKQYAGLFDAMERQRCKKAVIKLEADAHFALKLLQSPV
jgi:hypothetical protein